MPGFAGNIIKLLQRNKLIARLAEDMYSRVPYVLPGGRALKPLSVVLLLTYRCNLRCRMCFYYNEAEKSATQSMIHTRASEELTYEQIIAFIDDISAMGVKVLTLHGGEPLVYPRLFDIAAYAGDKGILVNFITNGLLLNEETITKMIDTRVNSVTISLDGPEALHDSVRGVSGAFSRIMQGIELLAAKKKAGLRVPKLAVSTYISAINQDGILQLFDIIKKTGITDWGVGLITYNSEQLSAATKKMLGIDKQGGQGDLTSLADGITGVDPDRLKKMREELKKANAAAGLQITFPSVAAIEKYGDPGFNEVDYCLYPWARAVVSPYGEVFPCIPMSMVDAQMGNIKKEPLSKIWNGPVYREFRKKLKKAGLFPVCSKCCTVNNIKPL